MSGLYVQSIYLLSDKKFLIFLVWYRAKALVFSNSSK